MLIWSIPDNKGSFRKNTSPFNNNDNSRGTVYGPPPKNAPLLFYWQKPIEEGGRFPLPWNKGSSRKIPPPFDINNNGLYNRYRLLIIILKGGVSS